MEAVAGFTFGAAPQDGKSGRGDWDRDQVGTDQQASGALEGVDPVGRQQVE